MKKSSLKYLGFTPSGGKNTGIKKSEFEQSELAGQYHSFQNC